MDQYHLGFYQWGSNMAYDRFLIAPVNNGLDTSLRPWLTPDDSFQQLTNAYTFRGRIRKRFGSILMGATQSLVTSPLNSRLRVQVATTDINGDASDFVPGVVYAVGQAFSIGNEIFTVNVLGTPAVMLSTGASATHTYDTTTGAFNFAGAAALTAVYFYPALPVMGLTNYENGTINNQPSFAFDTQFAYEFLTTAWARSTLGITPTWHGDNADFYWSTNWAGITADQMVMFVTNFQAHLGLGLVTDDPIWAYSLQFAVPGWQPFSYSPDAAINTTNQQPYTVTQTTPKNTGTTILSYVQTARIILPFKDRLILLNTIENNANGATPFDTANPTTTGITPTNYLTSTSKQFVNRCRYSHNGSPFSANAWLEPGFVYKPNLLATTVVADGAGFIDAPTDEEIISADFVKDRLVVYFERSTWELAYTGNQILPFVWQKINTELGAESTFSVVPFDKVVLGIGNVGVHACNGSNVERIDNLIPDEVFAIKNKEEGVLRTAGIRDYYTEMVYWTFPTNNQQTSQIYPDRVLVYNYKTGSWAFNDDTITTWGYFEQQLDRTWATTDQLWEEADFTWTRGVVQAQFRQILAGNQEGYVFIVLPDGSRNARVLQITDITTVAGRTRLTIIDHNLKENDYIIIETAQGITGLNNGIYSVSFVNPNIVELIPPDSPPYATYTGTYTGGGTASRVSNIQIKSKQWNPYVDKGRSFYLAKIDFCVLKTATGQITVDYFPSGSELSMVTAADETLMIMGNNVLETSPYALYPLEFQQVRLWHPVYFQTDGDFVQILISFNDEQIRNSDIAFSPFEIEGLILHTQPTRARLE